MIDRTPAAPRPVQCANCRGFWFRVVVVRLEALWEYCDCGFRLDDHAER